MLATSCCLSSDPLDWGMISRVLLALFWRVFFGEQTFPLTPRPARRKIATDVGNPACLGRSGLIRALMRNA